MQNQLIKCCIVALFTSLVSIPSQAQTSTAAAISARSAGDDLSGWVHVEVAVMIDTDNTTLSSEIWDASPVLTYPRERRWLTQYDEINALMDEWGSDAVTVAADGSIAVMPMIPPELPQDLLEEDGISGGSSEMAPTSELESGDETLNLGGSAPVPRDGSGQQGQQIDASSLAAVGERDKIARTVVDDAYKGSTPEGDTLSMMTDEQAPSPAVDTMSPQNAADRQPGQIAMDSLITESAPAESELQVTRIATERGLVGTADSAVVSSDTSLGENPFFLDIAQAQQEMLPDAADELDGIARVSEGIDWLDDYALDADTAEQNAGLDERLDRERAKPSLPAAYQMLPLQLLSEGLQKLTNSSGRVPISALAWLQPPEDSGAPVVIDTWQERNDTPIIQGTVALNNATERTLGIDIWLNTHADYMPPKYRVPSPPLSPERVLIIEPEKSRAPALSGVLPEFIDLRTGLNTTTSVGGSAGDDIDAQDGSVDVEPYRHAIQLVEQRVIREGYVRYIDHPALQVIASWRELTFDELYDLGETQRLRRDIDALTRSLTSKKGAGQRQNLAPATDAGSDRL